MFGAFLTMKVPIFDGFARRLKKSLTKQIRLLRTQSEGSAIVSVTRAFEAAAFPVCLNVVTE
jgi:hypothetical protein